jgi:hypothetical protein
VDAAAVVYPEAAPDPVVKAVVSLALGRRCEALM